MKIMISQPMKGKTEEQIRTERENVIKELEAQGHEIIDTVFDFGPEKNPIHYLAKSIETMAEVDCVVFMQGWNQARGCRIEYQIALEYSKFVKII